MPRSRIPTARFPGRAPVSGFARFSPRAHPKTCNFPARRPFEGYNYITAALEVAISARILVVEDERITAEDLRELLTDLGYTVVAAVSSGPEAIRLAQTETPDLVVMDIHLEGEMDGIEAARLLRSRFNIPVVYLTAYADTETLQRAQAAQPLGYVVKPFQEAQLHASIEMALAKHAAERASQEREEWLRSTLHAMGEGVISVDRSGAAMVLNSAAEAWTGWRAADAKGQLVHDIFALLDAASGEKTTAVLDAALLRGAPGDLDSRVVLRARGGEVRSVAGSIAPMRDHEGEISGAVIVFGSADLRPAAPLTGGVLEKEEEDGLSISGFRVVASSAKMRTVLKFARRVAESEASTILIEGESGTGKDVVANYMHHFGNRRKGPFVSLNCAAIPDTLIESELFGYEKGAFTDARASKAGILEIASGGTIFLDEIGEMPAPLQAKMLRVLEERKFRRLGGIRDIHVDLRVMAATNRTLVEAIDQGRFRLDLYYRLNVIQVCIPPLRERREDILPLARYFIQLHNARYRRDIKGLSHDAEAALLAYEWPGNARELRNIMERATLLEETDWIEAPSLQLDPRGLRSEEPRPAVPATPGAPPPAPTLEQTERSMLLQSLEDAYWNQTKAAAVLGISRDALRYKVRKFDLKPHTGRVKKQSA